VKAFDSYSEKSWDDEVEVGEFPVHDRSEEERESTFTRL